MRPPPSPTPSRNRARPRRSRAVARRPRRRLTRGRTARRAVGAHSKTNAVFLNHSPGALEDLAQAVQKGFMAAAPNPGSMLR